MLTASTRAQGYEHAKKATLEFLDGFKEAVDVEDREVLRCVTRTSLRTKLHEELADQLTDIVVDAVLTIRKPDEHLDLFMVRAALTPWQGPA
jgi:T-complex protein 1 subunit zeta